MDNATRILVVDDEETLCEALRFNLEAEGYTVDTALSAEEALTLRLADYHLILLDIMMGDISGLQLADILKRNPDTRHIPIIFCTARTADDDVIRGLDMGADDYISKPYSLGTMLARVRSVLRRSAATRIPTEDKADRLAYDGLVVVRSQKCCLIDGVEVKLPRKEFEILCKLMSHPGHVFSREELLRDIWSDDVVVDRVIDVNITRIRKKLGHYGSMIVTRSGYGYGFFAE